MSTILSGGCQEHRKGINGRCCAQRGGVPETVSFTIQGPHIHMIHDRKNLRAEPESEGGDVVISGHSHRPSIEDTGSFLCLNPGVAGPRRFRLPITLVSLWTEAGRPRAMIHPLVCCRY
nr:metallophosphoesterase family protein [Amylibacter sp.]